MPVHSLGGGCYRWGDSGKEYCGRGARTRAARQGRAAYASGYKGAMAELKKAVASLERLQGFSRPSDKYPEEQGGEPLYAPIEE